MAFVFLLLILNLAVVVWVVSKSCFSRQGLEFNHVFMFSIGFLFYWVLPILIGSLHFFSTDPRMHLWYGLFDAISQPILIAYLAICLGCYLSFYLGSEWIRWLLGGRPPRYRKVFFYRRLLNVPLVVSTLIASGFAFTLRDGLFKGYTAGFDPTQPGALIRRGDSTLYGTFIASSVVLLSLAFTNATKLHEDTNGATPFRKLILNPFFLIYFIFSILVLSLGGREYFLCSLFMVMIFYSVYFRRIALKTTLWVFAVVFAATGLFGMIRLGNSVSLDQVAINVFTEPIYVAFPLIYFLDQGVFEVIRFPIFLMSNFINLIPFVLLPNKVDLMLNPADYGYVAFSPVGAENSFFSFMINFGVVGSMMALFAVGALLSYLKVWDKNLLFRVNYIMLAGWLGFTFFREPFYLSIVKTMFEFSFLETLALVVAVQIVSTLIRVGHHQATATPLDPSSSPGPTLR